jgi:hypothetical protein
MSGERTDVARVSDAHSDERTSAHLAFILLVLCRHGGEPSAASWDASRGLGKESSEDGALGASTENDGVSAGSDGRKGGGGAGCHASDRRRGIQTRAGRANPE